MREIKFRAWHHGRKRMFEVVGFNFKHGTVTLNDDGLHYVTAQDNVVIEQYTGLKDKNGVEIYEGDVIKSPLNGIVAKVAFANGGFQSCAIPDPLRILYSLDTIASFLEVKGNIHESEV